jgi:hypothetical protein
MAKILDDAARVKLGFCCLGDTNWFVRRAKEVADRIERVEMISNDDQRGINIEIFLL